MNKYMEIANHLAQENIHNNHGGPFGAVIVKDEKVIGYGNNQVIKNNDPTAHAEIIAIRNACQEIHSFDLTGCELYTTCYPCPMCLSAIIWSNIKTIYYGNTKEDAADIGFCDNAIYQYIKSNNKDQSFLKLIPLDREKTIKTFEDFKNKSEKTMY